MRPAFERFWPDRRWNGRAARLTLAIAVHLLAVFLAYFLSPPITFKKPTPDLLVMTLPAPSLKSAKADTKKPKSHAAQHSATVPKVPKTELTAQPSPLSMMMVSSDVFKAGDISRIHSAPAASTTGDDDANGGDEQAAGVGPNGEKLYNAAWYREPTQAELAYYLPKNGMRSSSWGEIYCKTAPHFKVEDCHELGETPGSGLARSMREASWQFLVRPPQRGGTPMIGAWVRIRFDMHVTVNERPGSPRDADSIRPPY